jgi:hypothetical protein
MGACAKKCMRPFRFFSQNLMLENLSPSVASTFEAGRIFFVRFGAPVLVSVISFIYRVAPAFRSIQIDVESVRVSAPS